MAEEILRGHLARIAKMAGPCREFEGILWFDLSGSPAIDGHMLRYAAKNGTLSALDVTFTMGWRDMPRHIVPAYTSSVDAARSLAKSRLPDFWMSSGLCSLTGHASIGPDYNGPAGERLRAEWPEADFHSGFDADLKPGDGPHRECYAILSCMLQAMLSRAELATASPKDGTEHPPMTQGAR